MSEHATHCKDPHCYGCSCTPECDYWAEEPNVLTERERIIALLEADMGNIRDGKCISTNHYPETCHCDIIALIKGEQ